MAHRTRSLLRSALAAWAMCAWSAAPEEAHTVPYLPSASAGYTGVVRIENRSATSGEVRVAARDDAGRRTEAGVVALAGGAAVEFDMRALESGDAALGLTGTGPGQGDWRLELSTALDIEARAYARTGDFLTSLHDARLLSRELELALFHPGSETARRSMLRLANAGAERAALTVRGIDDAGAAGGPVTVELGPLEAASYAASELESGAAPGLDGSLGDGEGNWRLRLSAQLGAAYATNLLLADGSGVLSSLPGPTPRGGYRRVPLFPSASDGAGRRGLLTLDADDELDVLSLVPGPGGMLSDISRRGRPAGAAPRTEVLNATSSRPDLVATASADRADLAPGEAFTLSATVLNRGTADAPATTLRYYQSADATIEESDAQVAAEAVTALAAGGAARRSASLAAPTQPGAYYYGVCVDAVPDETDATNNCSAAPALVVEEPPSSGPNLVFVEFGPWGPSCNPYDLYFTTSLKIKNIGDVGAGTATLRYYRSTDPDVTADDEEFATSPLGVFHPGVTRGVGRCHLKPTAPGTYYHRVCIDPVPGETDTTDNRTSNTVVVTIGGSAS